MYHIYSEKKSLQIQRRNCNLLFKIIENNNKSSDFKGLLLKISAFMVDITKKLMKKIINHL